MILQSYIYSTSTCIIYRIKFADAIAALFCMLGQTDLEGMTHGPFRSQVAVLLVIQMRVVQRVLT